MLNSIQSCVLLSGSVCDGLPKTPKVGDVRIFPSAGGALFIDGRIFDGQQWRELDLNSMVSISRAFRDGNDIGPLMRSIAARVQQLKGCPVYYGRQGVARKSRYFFRGVPFSSIFPNG